MSQAGDHAITRFFIHTYLCVIPRSELLPCRNSFARMKFLRFLGPLLLCVGLAAPLPAAQFRALLYTKTNGWHHDSINHAVEAMQAIATMHSFELVWSEDTGRYFTDAGLEDFDVVIFLLTTGDVLNADQQAALERFVQSGKGFVGIHSASDTEYDWPWYRAMVGRMFHIHPRIQTATLEVAERDFPGMDRFPPRFLFTDEWYEFQAPESDDLHTLLTIDESTYEPHTDWGEKQGQGMGDFHPLAWFHAYDGGRAFYTALGHLAATYDDPAFRHHLFGGIYWAATGRGFRAE